MIHHRVGLIRCLVACSCTVVTVFLLNLFLVDSSLVRAAEPTLTDRKFEITSTLPIPLHPQQGTFVEIPVNLPGVQDGSANWGDCNNDGASDVLLTGQLASTQKIARVYQRMIDGSFMQVVTLTGVINGAAAWGDYDNDGWLDLILTGDSDTGPIAQVYHNERNSSICAFSFVPTSLTGVRDSAVGWGDYDADGQLDLLIAGANISGQPITKIYRNNHSAFVDSAISLPGIKNGMAIWGDYDNDGRVDLLLTGATASGAGLTKIFRNTGQGTLVDAQANNLPPLHDSAAAWGDYDNDGDLDLLLEGTKDDATNIAEIYRNDQGVFVKNTQASNLAGSLTWTGAAWGDFDTDGYLDALINSGTSVMAYHNEITGTFGSGIQVGPALLGGTATWGQYDNDGNLDVLAAGRSTSGDVTKIYRYSIIASSTPPKPPENLGATITGSDVTLLWSPPVTDDHTLLTGLSYNLQLGTRPGGIDIIAPMALTTTGYRLLPALGNVYEARALTLHNLIPGQRYYWSVQAIDTSYLGSAFAASQSFLIPFRVFLPIVLNDYMSFYENESETEPNNTYLTANGPLHSGQALHGRHNDERDYYSVYLRNPGVLTVDMDSANGGTQLQLYYQSTSGFIDYDPVPPYHLQYNGPAGWYYIYVYTAPTYVGTGTYTLTVTYP